MRGPALEGKNSRCSEHAWSDHKAAVSKGQILRRIIREGRGKSPYLRKGEGLGVISLNNKGG